MEFRIIQRSKGGPSNVWHLSNHGQYEDAERQLLKLIGLNSNYATGHSSYAFTLVALERYKEALAEANKATEEIWRLMGRAWVFYAMGRQTEADTELHLLIEGYQDFWAIQIAQTYAFRNEPDMAFKWLDAALEYRDPGLANILSSREFFSFQDDPRWEIFIDKLALLEAWRKMPAKFKVPDL